MEPDTPNPHRLETYASLLTAFTQKHNLISPNSVQYIEERHIGHCLALAQLGFPAGCTVVDWGTGGGLPAIPLAITFPEVQFVAVDAVGKKVLAVRAMARTLGLANLTAWHGRAEDWAGTLHYSVSRATAPLQALWSWHSRCVAPCGYDEKKDWKPGLICLKGGDLSDEIATLQTAHPSLSIKKLPLGKNFRASYFEEKYIMHICNTYPV